MQSSLKLTYTDKPQLLHETASVEVAIASAIQKAAKTDSTVAELLLARRKGEAIKLKQELIQTLEPLENKDLTGHITKYLLALQSRWWGVCVSRPFCLRTGS
eukprot:TRINITY_DN4006_c0_g1_i14.p2 TRINITY_DN4006_c0_g1~~TRINITY_DN4006_c0_g1_i14.p2  ORF type:complete len:109 (-),score=24.86 TRINITY_DN4006_c0_g1_i14:16-321(-)